MTIEIRALASSSAGNCYWIYDGLTPLLLECGIRLAEIREALGFRLSELGGCLISHEHGDHSKAVKGLLRAGVDCWMSFETAVALGLSDHRVHIALQWRQFRVGTWTIKAFPTKHNAAEPIGFLLGSGNERLVFATDTAFIPTKFACISFLMVECNYQTSILREGVRCGEVSVGHKNRLLSSHMSLETLCKWLKANDLSQLKETWLLHASDDNSNAEEMIGAVSAITGKPTYIAEARIWC